MALPLALLSSIAPPVIQAGTSLFQNKAANNLQKRDYIPPALNESINRIKNNLMGGRFPGQSQTENNIRQSTASTVNRAGRGSFSDKLAVTAAADAGEKQAFTDLGGVAEDFAFNSERMLSDMLTRKAGIQQANDQAFVNQRQALRDASTQNLFNAVNNLSTIGVGASNGVFGNKSSFDVGRLMTESSPQEITQMINSGAISWDSLSPEDRLKLAKYLNTQVGK